MLCHPQDLSIDRESRKQYQEVALWDCDGNYLGNLPAAMTDEQIKRAVYFANSAYALGYKWGSDHRAMEIRASLGIPEPAAVAG